MIKCDKIWKDQNIRSKCFDQFYLESVLNFRWYSHQLWARHSAINSFDKNSSSNCVGNRPEIKFFILFYIFIYFLKWIQVLKHGCSNHVWNHFCTTSLQWIDNDQLSTVSSASTRLCSLSISGVAVHVDIKCASVAPWQLLK